MTARKRDIDRKAQAGFTLIELIAVIVILGILAVVAVPKYLDLTDQAQEAAAKAVKGNMLSAMSLAFASHRVNGLSASGTGDSQYITSCDTLEYYVEGGFPEGTTCASGVVTFVDATTETLISETNSTPARF